MSEFALLGKRTFFQQVLKIADRYGSGCSSQGNIIFGSKAALETIDAFLEHAINNFGLSRVELSP